MVCEGPLSIPESWLTSAHVGGERLTANPVDEKYKFVRVCSLVGRYLYTMYIVTTFEIVFSFNVKYNNILPCLHNIRLFYSI